jgi:hypothetical protein
MDRLTNIADCDDWITDADAVDDALCEIENGIKLLRFQDNLVSLDGNAGGGWTWAAGSGRGVKADLKYMSYMLTELKYPATVPVTGMIKIDFGLFNHKLFGDCLYGVDKKTVLTVDSRHPVAYPLISTGDKSVFRRSMTPLTLEIESGLDEPWAAIEGSTAYEFDCILGLKCEYGLVNSAIVPTKFAISSMDRYGVWTKCPGEYMFDDATGLRSWLEGCITSDHQWNEALFHLEDTFDQIKRDQPASFNVHQDILIPFEGIRALLCDVYNIPFKR